MRSRPFLIVATLVVLLVVVTGGIYAYDRGRENEIAKGITVGGVDVGGMKEAAARAKLRSAVLEPLNQPVVAHYEGHRYTLTPAQARVGVDIDGSIQQAIDRSRSGNILQRTARNLRGQSIDENIKLDVAYNHHAISRLVKRISGGIDRQARDATLNLEAGDVNPTPSATGLAVRAASLRRQLKRSLLSVTASRDVKVHTTMVEPKVTSKDLAEKYPAVVIVQRGAFKLSLYKHLKFAKSYGIAVGRVGLETPAGLYHVQNKAINPAWTMPNSSWVAPKDRGKVIPGGTPENPLKARWLGIYAGAGIHGTDDS
ncbi:MAG TPA: peptidoglycan binding domain-containing protein, partial [Solirubrobacteraceae bacterium]|nr:peptidoglycan binding domain-containing protein [Solirubrobacteraceae bacterium]